MELINVPSQQIYEFNCDINLIDQALKDLESQKIEWFDDNADDSESSAGYLNIENRIPWYHDELFIWMQNCIDEVSKITIKTPLIICDAWVTKSKFKQYAKRHNHAFSMLSGILYFTDHKDSNTMFEYYDHNRRQFGSLFDKKNTLQGHLNYIPKKGKFIIFPSDMYHHVQTHSELKNTRYTLAINTFFNGLVSNETTSMLELNVVTVKDRYTTWKSQQINKDLK
jgi:hypothetical protein